MCLLKIRDRDGAWRQLEIYIRDHSNAEFSHGLCPACVDQALASLSDSLSEDHAASAKPGAT